MMLITIFDKFNNVWYDLCKNVFGALTAFTGGTWLPYFLFNTENSPHVKGLEFEETTL